MGKRVGAGEKLLGVVPEFTTESNEVVKGGIYEHCQGGYYQVGDIIFLTVVETDQEADDNTIFFDATEYEETDDVRKIMIIEHDGLSSHPEAAEYVIYTQLETQGFPAGSLWLRLKSDFLSKVDGDTLDTSVFTLIG